MWTWEQLAKPPPRSARPRAAVLGHRGCGGNYIPCDIFLRGRGKSMFTPDHRLGFEPEDMEAWYAYWQSMREAGASARRRPGAGRTTTRARPASSPAAPR